MLIRSKSYSGRKKSYSERKKSYFLRLQGYFDLKNGVLSVFKNSLPLCAVILLTSFIALGTFTRVSADVITEHRDNVSFSIAEQCLFQGTGTTSKTFSGTALNGQEIGGSTAANKFVDEDGAETNVHEFNVSCNVYTGYTVKAYATNLEHQLDFDPGNPDLILFVNDKPVTETSDSYDYLIANNDTQGYWTASVSGDDTSNTFSTNASNPTTIKLGNTITAEDGDTFSVAYKAYVGKLTPPGSYNGEAIYILASNPTPDIPEDTVFQYNITYDANGGTGLTITSQSGTARGSTTITPPTGLVGPEGEEFTGWSKTQGADDIDFPAGENITLTSSTFSSYPATLYAVYGNYMQDFTAEKCAATPEDSAITLTDKRDGKKYLVSRIKNGSCFMVQNLALDGGTLISSDDSDLPSGINYELPTTRTTGFDDNTMLEGTHEDSQEDSSSNTGHFYTFYVATAGMLEVTTSSDEGAPYSICPKNWRLPNISLLIPLSSYYSNYTDFKSAWRPAFIGYIRSGSWSNVNDFAVYMSRSNNRHTINDSHAFKVMATTTGDNFSSFSNEAISVRCIFSPRMN